MKESAFLRGACLWSSRPGTNLRLWVSTARQLSHYTATSTAAPNEEEPIKKVNDRGEWFMLPPFSHTINASMLGKKISSAHQTDKKRDNSADANITALKWVLHRCPKLPRSLIQKLFRLRQVRRESSSNTSSDLAVAHQIKRVAAKDAMNIGDRIFLPVTVQERSSTKQKLRCSEKEKSSIHELVLHKDPAIIVLNKPPGMPVQGGVGITRSLDELAATCLCYDYSEPPRLVHRLDRDSSGILVMGRTQASATLLQSIFREKTLGASTNESCIDNRILQKRYLALVIGRPRLQKGTICAPLQKVVVDGGKSERITMLDDAECLSSQYAVTEYQVISSWHDFTWLELCPTTGRKHQLRVHCAEALGTPILGDHKYGRLAHKRIKRLPWFDVVAKSNEMCGGKTLPCEHGSILKTLPHLHLHCKEMVFPDVSYALQHLQSASESDILGMKSLKFVAPMPAHMQKSWEILQS